MSIKEKSKRIIVINFIKFIFRNLFSNRSNFCHKFQVYFNHKQAVRAFNIDTIHNKPVGLAEGLSYRLNLIYGVMIENKNGISYNGTIKIKSR